MLQSTLSTLPSIVKYPFLRDLKTCSGKCKKALVQFVATDNQKLRPVNFEFSHTNHSLFRSHQRGIDDNRLAIALQYGDTFYKQGLIFFVLGKSNIPERLSKEIDKYSNLVVVVSGSSDEILTCYRSSKPFKNINIKSKRLAKNNH